MKVVLLAATPAEHAIGSGAEIDRKDFAFSSYNYAIGLLEACVLADPVAQDAVQIARRDLPVARGVLALPDAVLQDILSERPDVVGLSCYCWSLDLLLDAARRLADARPGLFVLAGGPSASFDAPAILRAHPCVDAIVRGEGETAFVALCRRRFREPWRVPGVTCRDADGALHHDEKAVCEVDLAAQPSPYLSGVLKPRAPSLLLEPSRGCRFRCSFCSWSTRRGPIRHQSRQRLVAELRWAVSHGYAGVNFCDTAINHDTDRLRELVDDILVADPERKLAFSLFLRQERLDDEQFDLLRRVRCDEIIVGLESIHDDVLRHAGKPPFDRDAFEARLARLGRDGHRVTVSIMSGLPGDTIAGFADTLDYLEGLMARIPDAVNFVCCFWLAVLPGTRFSALAPRFGLEAMRVGTPYAVRSNDFSSEDMVSLARMIVDRAAHNPRFRCEEIHRQAAETGAIPTTMIDRPRPARPATPAGSVPGPGVESLLRPWAPGQRRGAWVLVSTAAAMAGDGVGTCRFRRVDAPVDVLVTLAVRDDERDCYVRTRRCNIYYRSKGAGPVGADAIPNLLEAVRRLVAFNETRG